MAESAETPTAAANQAHASRRRHMASYWAANLRLIGALLAIWFAASYGPILAVRQLNRIGILTGFPLGYYMGAQGSLVVFVALIFYYARRMERLDREYGFDQE